MLQIILITIIAILTGIIIWRYSTSRKVIRSWKGPKINHSYDVISSWIEPSNNSKYLRKNYFAIIKIKKDSKDGIKGLVGYKPKLKFIQTDYLFKIGPLEK